MSFEHTKLSLSETAADWIAVSGSEKKKNLGRSADTVAVMPCHDTVPVRRQRRAVYNPAVFLMKIRILLLGLKIKEFFATEYTEEHGKIGIKSEKTFNLLELRLIFYVVILNSIQDLALGLVSI